MTRITPSGVAIDDEVCSVENCDEPAVVIIGLTLALGVGPMELPFCEKHREIVNGPPTSVSMTHSPGEWNYACRCLRCRWEQWWNEADNGSIGMPDEPHPDGGFLEWFNDRERWSGPTHPNDG